MILEGAVLGGIAPPLALAERMAFEGTALEGMAPPRALAGGKALEGGGAERRSAGGGHGGLRFTGGPVVHWAGQR